MSTFSKYLFSFSVKPTVLLAGDRTPELTDVDTDDDENTIEPTGDLAELTASVCEGMPRDEDFPGGSSCSCTAPYKGKGKGVGKGSSGSSGPPQRKKKTPAAPRPTPREIDDGEESEDAEAEEEPVATQTIMVKKKKKEDTHIILHTYLMYPQRSSD